MMRRKIIRQGHNTLTVTIPTGWAQKNKISAGDDVFIDESDSALLITKSESKKELKHISVNVDNFNYHFLSRYIIHLYRTNYSKITLNYTKNETFNDKSSKKESTKDTVQKIMKRFVGAEIISQTANRIEIEFLVPQSENDEELDKIERRIFYILKETLNELILAIKGDFSQFSKSVYDYHDNITKFINYYLRELYLSKKSDYEKKSGYSFYILLDTLVDKIRHVCEMIDENGCTEKTRSYLKEIFDMFIEEYNIILSNKDQMVELMQKRYKLKDRINAEKFTFKEYKVLSEVLFYLESFNTSSEYLLARTMNVK